MAGQIVHRGVGHVDANGVVAGLEQLRHVESYRAHQTEPADFSLMYTTAASRTGASDQRGSSASALRPAGPTGGIAKIEGQMRPSKSNRRKRQNDCV